MRPLKSFQDLRPPLPDRPLYTLDLQWYERAGVSLTVVLALRRCPDCQARMGWKKKGEGPDPFGPWQEQAKGLRECCSQREDFITAQTPLLEAAFRLLAASDHPLSLGDLTEEIRRRYRPEGRDVSPSTLQRVLEAQSAYGIQVVQPEEEKPSS